MPGTGSGNDGPTPPSESGECQSDADGPDAFNWRSVDERMLRRAQAVVATVCRIELGMAADAATDALIRLIVLDLPARDPQRLLNGVAVNCAYEVLRRHRNAPTTPVMRASASSDIEAEDMVELSVSSEPQPDELLQLDMLKARIGDALNRLPTRDRAVLRAVYFDGVEPSQLDRDAGASPGTHKSRLHRARERLRAAGRFHDL